MTNIIPCVILSGGKSSRMGEDKSLMQFDNKTTMIEYLYKKLIPLFKEVYISAKTDKFDSLQLPNKQLILDTNQTIFSPMIALETIFQTLKDEKIFIITVDTPFVENETIDTLIKNSTNFSITIAKDSQNNTHNLCGVFSRDNLPTIQKMIKQDIHKINYMIKNSKNYQEIVFDNSEQFLNINTKESFQEAKNALKKF
ncbi:MAG: molybdenum cofactor guanylyltransferase MobA [Arcobacteraceae bacterium]|nr:molybdenum cofactor guanylyltransferase MobA [Arcobacteraceae bacterium]